MLFIRISTRPGLYFLELQRQRYVTSRTAKLRESVYTSTRFSPMLRLLLAVRVDLQPPSERRLWKGRRLDLFRLSDVVHKVEADADASIKEVRDELHWRSTAANEQILLRFHLAALGHPRHGVTLAGEFRLLDFIRTLYIK